MVLSEISRYIPDMKARWNRLATVGSVLSLAAIVGACAAPATSSTPPPLRLVTAAARQQVVMDAAFSGELSVDGEGCVRAKAAGDASMFSLVWPQGYTVRGDSKSFEVVDANKNVVARSGTSLKVGGGLVDAVSDSWTESSCAKGSLWMVAE